MHKHFKGDSGGPVVFSDPKFNGKYFFVGVINAGISCGIELL